MGIQKPEGLLVTISVSGYWENAAGLIITPEGFSISFRFLFSKQVLPCWSGRNVEPYEILVVLSLPAELGGSVSPDTSQQVNPKELFFTALSWSGYTYTMIQIAQQATCPILLAGQLKSYPKTPRYPVWVFTASSNVNTSTLWPSLCYSFDTNLVFRCWVEFFVSEGSVVPPLLSAGAKWCLLLSCQSSQLNQQTVKLFRKRGNLQQRCKGVFKLWSFLCSCPICRVHA